MCIRDTFAISYNERTIIPWAQQQLLCAKPAYAWTVPRKWHQRKAGMERCHFLLALLLLLRGKAILASIPQTTNTSKLTQHHPLPRKFRVLSFHDHVTKRSRDGGIWGGKWRLLGELSFPGPIPSGTRKRPKLCYSEARAQYLPSDFFKHCNFRHVLPILWGGLQSRENKRSLQSPPNFHGPIKNIKPRPNDRNIQRNIRPNIVGSCCEGLAKRTQHHATIYAISANIYGSQSLVVSDVNMEYVHERFRRWRRKVVACSLVLLVEDNDHTNIEGPRNFFKPLFPCLSRMITFLVNIPQARTAL